MLCLCFLSICLSVSPSPYIFLLLRESNKTHFTPILEPTLKISSSVSSVKLNNWSPDSSGLHGDVTLSPLSSDTSCLQLVLSILGTFLIWLPQAQQLLHCKEICKFIIKSPAKTYLAYIWHSRALYYFFRYVSITCCFIVLLHHISEVSVMLFTLLYLLTVQLYLLVTLCIQNMVINL